MNATRVLELARGYSGLKVALIGDFCLDRYLEIDPALEEVSIETGLPVHNVVSVRAQPGGAGTILNNLASLGIGEILPVGFCGEDGEGYELLRALRERPGVNLELFLTTPGRRTFTYCKPLLVSPGKAPVELNRLDSKNWSSTPAAIENQLAHNARLALERADAAIVLDQVDRVDTGVVTRRVLEEIGKVQAERPTFLVLADSRRGLADYPPLTFKMNARELASFSGQSTVPPLEDIRLKAANLARRNGRCVFVSLSEAGILGAQPDGKVEHVPALPLRGEIDVVGAGDAVSANLTAALACGASLREALVLANAAASVVVHKLGTTGTATMHEILEALDPR